MVLSFDHRSAAAQDLDTILLMAAAERLPEEGDDSAQDVSDDQDKPDLKLVVTSDDLTKQIAQGYETEIEIETPAEGLDIRMLEAMADLYLEPPQGISHMGTTVIPRSIFDGPGAPFGGFPNPTLGHYTLARAMRDLAPEAETVAGFGTGSGFVELDMMRTHPATTYLLVDMLPHAGQLTTNAYHANTSRFLTPEGKADNVHAFESVYTSMIHRVHTLIGRAPDSLEGKQADIAVAAPFFLPGICTPFPGIFDVWAHSAKNIGADLYIAHSSVVRDMVNGAAQGAGLGMETVSSIERELAVEYHGPENQRPVTVDGRFSNELHDLYIGMGAEFQPDEQRYMHALQVSKLS